MKRKRYRARHMRAQKYITREHQTRVRIYGVLELRRVVKRSNQLKPLSRCTASPKR
uniref:Uncharacterized protein n=1 Tax=Oryza brachyantha TaxID=4533 RepID=J3LGS3_ORYBR